jgi:hypothetical protein
MKRALEAEAVQKAKREERDRKEREERRGKDGAEGEDDDPPPVFSKKRPPEEGGGTPPPAGTDRPFLGSEDIRDRLLLKEFNDDIDRQFELLQGECRGALPADDPFLMGWTGAGGTTLSGGLGTQEGRDNMTLGGGWAQGGDLVFDLARIPSVLVRHVMSNPPPLLPHILLAAIHACSPFFQSSSARTTSVARRAPLPRGRRPSRGGDGRPAAAMARLSFKRLRACWTICRQSSGSSRSQVMLLLFARLAHLFRSDLHDAFTRFKVDEDADSSRAAMGGVAAELRQEREVLDDLELQVDAWLS